MAGATLSFADSSTTISTATDSNDDKCNDGRGSTRTFQVIALPLFRRPNTRTRSSVLTAAIPQAGNNPR